MIYDGIEVNKKRGLSPIVPAMLKQVNICGSQQTSWGK
jgi:hypothetical protein